MTYVVVVYIANKLFICQMNLVWMYNIWKREREFVYNTTKAKKLILNRFNNQKKKKKKAEWNKRFI